MKKNHCYFLIGLLFLQGIFACSVQKKIMSQAQTALQNSALANAHVGISIFDPATEQYLYRYQADKYFVPASNTKLPTCYAMMKFMGDSIPFGELITSSSGRVIIPAGDPGFLLPEFIDQQIFNKLKQSNTPITLDLSAWQDEPWGSGWSWNDYEADYMAPRSVLPLYGNVVRFTGSYQSLQVVPGYFNKEVTIDSTMSPFAFPAHIRRDLAANHFYLGDSSRTDKKMEVPFYTEPREIIAALLQDTLGIPVAISHTPLTTTGERQTLYTRPIDSLLRPMMYRSDNFFAEQSLLMVSHKLLGKMSDAAVIDTLLKGVLKELPQKPHWVDGSGLSRYDLFSPNDFVFILNKMQQEFGMPRMKGILPTGNTGTLAGYYKTQSGKIFAKTGTLGGVVCISGYYYTPKNRLLIFSVLVNNHQASASAVRHAIENFLNNALKSY